KAFAAVLAFALPVPLLRDIAGQHAIGLIGVNAERLGKIGVESGAIGGDGRLQHRVAGTPLAAFGAGRPRDRAVVETDHLALVAPDLPCEDMARDPTTVTAHDIRR